MTVINTVWELWLKYPKRGFSLTAKYNEKQIALRTYEDYLERFPKRAMRLVERSEKVEVIRSTGE